jgi:hypothetical protein
MEAGMDIRVMCSALIIGALLAVALPSSRSVAQANDVGASPPKTVVPHATAKKHRYWRHRGGRHPHYGSRRVGT